MAKTVSSIKQQIDKIDLVIQILDARCVNISSNSDLIKICKNKPIINIALKSDLADLKNKMDNVYYLDKKTYINNNKVYSLFDVDNKQVIDIINLRKSKKFHHVVNF